MEKLKIWLLALRAYSLPISIMSWSVPFLYAILCGGSFSYGIVALLGIVVLHLGVNIFDDAIDYTREKFDIEKGLKESFCFQKNKCATIFDGSLTLKQYYLASFILFFIAILIGVFFFFIYGAKLLYIVIPSAILCFFYPVLGGLGIGEIIVAIVFSPLLYSGVYFVMMGNYSFDILLLSVPTGLLTVAVLHNHMLLDYKIDEKNRKITLCRLCNGEMNAYILLVLIIIGAYLSIIYFVLVNKLSYFYLLSFLSFPTAISLFYVMYNHIKNPEKMVKMNIFMGNLKEVNQVPDEQKGFLIKFLIVRNLLSIFTLLICISMVLDRVF